MEHLECWFSNLAVHWNWAIKKLMVPGPHLQKLRSNWSGVWLGHWDF